MTGKTLPLASFILVLFGMTVSNPASAACASDPSKDWGSRLIMSIRDCTAISDTSFPDQCRAEIPLVFVNEQCKGGQVNGSSTEPGLGSTYGQVIYNGPAALPTVKGYAFSSADSRNVSRTESWQRYTYDGASSSPLPLVADIEFSWLGNLDFGTSQYSEYAEVAVGITVWDLGKMNGLSAADFPDYEVGGYNLNQAECGDDGYFGFQNGAIVATALYYSYDPYYYSPPLVTPPPVYLDLGTGCDGSPVTVNPGDSFIVSTFVQNFGSRGGSVDMSHTMNVKFADDTPPEVLINLVDNIEPACDDCGPEQVNAQVQIKTGGKSCLKTKGKGMIFANIFGSDALDVSTIRTDESLVLGSLDTFLDTQLQKCKEKYIDDDDYVDLACKFNHAVLNSTDAESVEALLRGETFDGTPFEGSDDLCVKH